MERLFKIQQALKAPKNQFNSYGGYAFRFCEDILEAVKPHLKENNCLLILTDEIVNKGDRYYLKATATLYGLDGKEIYHTCAEAREPENKKGMDEAQITGATSSYARKYALNGLFLIDDVKDADATNKHGKDEEITKEKLVCKQCGKSITKGAYDAWGGLCSECYRQSKKGGNNND